ncbi:MAG TPA: hypothetical protein VGE13_01775 [Candidatus Saccharimonadales bacterium]
MTETTLGETVSWINVIPLNRREKIARWWVESVRQQRTYNSKRQSKQEFMTHIGLDEVNSLACDALREALLRQKQDREMRAGSVTFPRATPDGSTYLGSVTIPSRPLMVTFTERGVAEATDEDY